MPVLADGNTRAILLLEASWSGPRLPVRGQHGRTRKKHPRSTCSVTTLMLEIKTTLAVCEQWPLQQVRGPLDVDIKWHRRRAVEFRAGWAMWANTNQNSPRKASERPLIQRRCPLAPRSRRRWRSDLTASNRNGKMRRQHCQQSSPRSYAAPVTATPCRCTASLMWFLHSDLLSCSAIPYNSDEPVYATKRTRAATRRCIIHHENSSCFVCRVVPGARRCPLREPQIAVGVYFNAEKYYCPADAQAFATSKPRPAACQALHELPVVAEHYIISPRAWLITPAPTAASHGRVDAWREAEANDPSGPARIAAGAHDAYFASTLGRQEVGQPVMLRLGHEMNGTGIRGAPRRANGVRHQPQHADGLRGPVAACLSSLRRRGRNVCWVGLPNIPNFNEHNTLAQPAGRLRRSVPRRRLRRSGSASMVQRRREIQVATFPDLLMILQTIVALTTNRDDRRVWLLRKRRGAGRHEQSAWIHPDVLHDIRRSILASSRGIWFDRDKRQGETDWRFTPRRTLAPIGSVNSTALPRRIELERE